MVTHSYIYKLCPYYVHFYVMTYNPRLLHLQAHSFTEAHKSTEYRAQTCK